MCVSECDREKVTIKAPTAVQTGPLWSTACWENLQLPCRLWVRCQGAKWQGWLLLDAPHLKPNVPFHLHTATLQLAQELWGPAVCLYFICTCISSQNIRTTDRWVKNTDYPVTLAPVRRGEAPPTETSKLLINVQCHTMMWSWSNGQRRNFGAFFTGDRGRRHLEEQPQMEKAVSRHL